MANVLYELRQDLDLIGRQIFLVAFGIAVNQVNTLSRKAVEINNPGPATLATPRGRPSQFAQPRTVTNHVARIGIVEQMVLQCLQLFVCPVRCSEGDKRGEFNKRHALFVRCQRIVKHLLGAYGKAIPNAGRTASLMYR
jgi:hypothetical protein